jgi:hypothetical protein
MSFERARAIADAVLLEDYVLHPYRPTSPKNRYRWTFGVLAPRDWSEAGGSEPSWLEAQVLVAGARPRLRGRLRFLHVIERRVEAPDGTPLERLDIDGRSVIPWEEAELREIDFDVDVERGSGSGGRRQFAVPAHARIEMLRDASAVVVGRIVRECHAVSGTIRAWSEPMAGDGESIARVSIHVENLTPYPFPRAERAEAMRHSCVSTHLLLEAEEGRFVSLLDAPPPARDAAAACTCVRAHPVLAGEPGHYDTMLCSPVILYDHPQVAAFAPGQHDPDEVERLEGDEQ